MKLLKNVEVLVRKFWFINFLWFYEKHLIFKRFEKIYQGRRTYGIHALGGTRQNILGTALNQVLTQNTNLDYFFLSEFFGN